MELSYRLVGARLNRDLFNVYGSLLVSSKTVLDQDHIDLLIRNNVELDLRDFVMPEGRDVFPVAEFKEAPSNDVVVSQAAEECKRIFEAIREEGIVPMDEINSHLLPSVYEAADYPSLYSVLSGLQAKDDYTYRHNIGVGVISTMIGRWLKLDEQALDLLTTAATLHDVGKINIEDDILNKPGRFTDDEYSVMKRHTTFGYEIIKKTRNLNDKVALVALQHHEREDGRGYPNGIKGGSIDYFSKIVAVADVFHAMTSKRVYKDANPFYEVIGQMKADGFGKLDPSIVSVFVRRVMEMSVGSFAELTDGRVARIVLVNEWHPVEPLVEANGVFIDLSKDKSVKLHKIVG